MIPMLRQALFLARFDLRHLFRGRETWLWTFLMPVVFFYFMGTVTSGFRTSSRGDTLALKAPADAGFLADHLVKRLEERGYRIARPGPSQLAGYTRVLELPAGMTRSVLAGQRVTLTLVRKGGGPGSDLDQVRIARAMYTTLADMAVAGRDGAAVTSDALKSVASRPHALTVRVTSAGSRRHPPVGFEQAIPGMMVMFTLLVLFTTGSVILTVERNQGLLRRLAATPLSRGAIVLGKWLARMALGAIQIGFAMVVARVAFGLHWGPHLTAIVILMAAYAALVATLGLLLGNEARTEGQAIAIGVLASNLLAALGGCWWPIEITPPWVQKLALLLPTGWAMDAMHKLVNFGASGAAVIPHIVGMTCAALAAGYVLARRFRFQ